MEITTAQLNSVPFKYAAAVRTGEIIAGKRIKQAVERFYTWIETADDDGYYLDHQKGLQVINFFHVFLIHTKGKMAGKPFILSPFQQFTLYNLFGWLENTSQGQIRRINNVYEKIGKKNGKTAVMAGVGLYCMSFDLEYGAEIYVGATKEDQAKLCFNQAADFINRSSALKTMGFSTYQRELKFKKYGSSFKPLGGDSKTQDGINAHLAIIDEYHSHRDDSVKENLESSMAARIQPIVYTITTAGVNIAGVCKKFEESCENILDGTAKDDHFFIMMHDLDADDDWQLIENWTKANPNMGVSVEKSFLIKEYNKAKNQPSKIPNFKTKHLNMWVDAPEIWIPSEIWKRNNVEVEDYEALFRKKAMKFGCYAATDLSTRIDLTALVYLTNPDEDGNRFVKLFAFCPSDNIDQRSKEDAVPYRYWADAGYLTATPGNVIDYEEIKKTTLHHHFKYHTVRNEFDQWNAEQLRNDLAQLGVETSFFSQSIGVISEPTKELEKLVYEGKIKHDGNPILEWALSGCVIYKDANENIKVHKGRSHAGVKRVDPIIALIMALGGAISVEETNNKSKYNDPEAEISFGV
ncbi:terminase large subunit [Lutibacter holmesii]|uniref:Terminase large subunit n=1 Tax=Lutibacter holmesii TaxID=1137985 RepID=A0ABW3WN54_9FLAO